MVGYATEGCESMTMRLERGSESVTVSLRRLGLSVLSERDEEVRVGGIHGGSQRSNGGCVETTSFAFKISLNDAVSTYDHPIPPQDAYFKKVKAPIPKFKILHKEIAPIFLLFRLPYLTTIKITSTTCYL